MRDCAAKLDGSGAIESERGVAISASVAVARALPRPASCSTARMRENARSRQRLRDFAPRALFDTEGRRRRRRTRARRASRRSAARPCDGRWPHVVRAELRNVRAQRQQARRGGLDEGRLRGAARERLEAERARAGEEIEHGWRREDRSEECSSTPRARGRRWGARSCRAARRSFVRATGPRRCARAASGARRRASPAAAARRSSRRARADTRCRTASATSSSLASDAMPQPIASSSPVSVRRRSLRWPSPITRAGAARCTPRDTITGVGIRRAERLEVPEQRLELERRLRDRDLEIDAQLGHEIVDGELRERDLVEAARELRNVRRARP